LKRGLSFSPRGRRWQREALTDEGPQAVKLQGEAPLQRRNSTPTRDFARVQRREPTRAEAMFWQAVRGRRFSNLKFKRQLAIGPYIADFCCFDHRLIVELDGEPHSDPEQRLHDLRRDAFLRGQGYLVLRFTNEQVLTGLELVLRQVDERLALARRPSSDPASPGHLLPRGEKESRTLQTGDTI
jgi:very-short-patch-repair endonuclease